MHVVTIEQGIPEIAQGARSAAGERTEEHHARDSRGGKADLELVIDTYIPRH